MVLWNTFSFFKILANIGLKGNKGRGIRIAVTRDVMLAALKIKFSVIYNSLNGHHRALLRKYIRILINRKAFEINYHSSMIIIKLRL